MFRLECRPTDHKLEITKDLVDREHVEVRIKAKTTDPLLGIGADSDGRLVVGRKFLGSLGRSAEGSFYVRSEEDAFSWRKQLRRKKSDNDGHKMTTSRRRQQSNNTWSQFRAIVVGAVGYGHGRSGQVGRAGEVLLVLGEKLIVMEIDSGRTDGLVVVIGMSAIQVQLGTRRSSLLLGRHVHVDFNQSIDNII